MITFILNGEKQMFEGNPDLTLLKYLRNEKHLTSVKDGCTDQAACGACTVEINGKAMLSCVQKMGTLQDAVIFTPEGFPEYVKETIAKAFVNKGAVQCGFCTPGLISRTKVLLEKNKRFKKPSSPIYAGVQVTKKLKKPFCMPLKHYMNISISKLPRHRGKSVRHSRNTGLMKRHWANESLWMITFLMTCCMPH